MVPSRGSVGASGDLAPLAHIALVLIGEGEAEFQRRPDGRRRGSRLASGLEALRLQAKEGISLVNGTQAMAALASLAIVDSAKIWSRLPIPACALSLDALRGTPRAFDARIHDARPHPGQQMSARVLSQLLEASPIRASHKSCRRVQDAYSLRCAPQVHGAVRDTLSEARRVVSIELNSATDNPLVLDGEMFSGGNFHGEHLAFACDYLAIALAALAGISERRIDRLVNPALNEGLPAFLAVHPGLESGFMMLQVTAAALVAECRVFWPGRLRPGSITTSGNKEDFVSMGMTAALKLSRMVELVRTVLAIEMMTAGQALEFLRPLRSSPLLEHVRAGLAEVAPPRRSDQPFSATIEAAIAWLRQWRKNRPPIAV